MPTRQQLDFTVHGDDLQFGEITLAPAEAVVAETGGMMYLDEV